MSASRIAGVIEKTYAIWPDQVNTSGKIALGAPSFRIKGLWSIFDEADETIESIFVDASEKMIAQIVSWALFNAVAELGKSMDLVKPREVPNYLMMRELAICAQDPGFYPEIQWIIEYYSQSAE